jgi:molybdopterin synthase sulfur carrier subunit
VPRVVLSVNLSEQFAGGLDSFDVEATNVRQMIRALDKLYPGLGSHIEDKMAVAIDGVIYPHPERQPIAPDSEVVIIPRLPGG